ncbi:MAG: hypothetical protein HFI09_03075 [Bacilli bacterium]|nr:hypothetical protein [Bacilli bacterium]
MFEVKEYMETCNNGEFYRYMGRFFAERIFRRELPYLINDRDKIWYLFFDKKDLAAFCGVVMNQNGTTFTDFYILPSYRAKDNMIYIAKYMTEMYESERIRILTNSKEEMELWSSLGYIENGKKGSYTTFIHGEEQCV